MSDQMPSDAWTWDESRRCFYRGLGPDQQWCVPELIIEEVLRRCGKGNCMGHEIDGIASWVRKEVLEKAEQRNAKLERVAEAVKEENERRRNLGVWSLGGEVDKALTALDQVEKP